MAIRRPLVRSGGRTRQLPAGDILAGVPVYVPAYQAAGTMLKLSFTTAQGITAKNSAGATFSIQAVING